MNVAIAKVIGLVVVLLGLIAGLVFSIHTKADPLVIGGLATAIGAGATAAFRFFTGDKTPPSGPAAVLLVAGTILAAGGAGCSEPQVARETTREIVLKVAGGVELADQACASFALLKSDLELAKACRAGYVEAREALELAELGVDAWESAGAENVPCAVKHAVDALDRIVDAIERHGGRAPGVIGEVRKAASVMSSSWGECRV